MANEFKVKKGLIVQGSGSVGDTTILDVQGNQGQLFSITDSLEGTLFSVSDISGIPILDVNSNEIVKIGTFGSEGLIINGSNVTSSGNISAGGKLTVDGTVGIGALVVGTKLQVNSSTTDLVARFISSDNKAAIEVSDDDTTGYISAENDAISIGSVLGAHANNLNIKSTNVGIGTTTPGQKLEVIGNISASGNIEANTGELNGNLTFNGDNRHIYFGGNNTFIGERSNSTELELRGGGSNTAATVFIDNSGNLGLGVSNPSEKLHVDGNAVITGTLTAQEFHTEFVSASIIFESGSTKFGDTSDDIHQFSGSLRVTGSGDHYILGGNVGIGTTTPSEKLQVNGNIAISGSNATLQLREGSAELYKFTAGGTSLDMTVNGTDAISIFQAGQVGIGTTTPPEKLTVVGDISASVDIHAQQNLYMGLRSDDKKLHLYNNQNLNYIYTSHSASVNNAQLTIQGANYTHAVNFKDSYSNQDNYATLSGGYTHDSKLILFNSSSQLTTTLSTATSSLNHLNVGGNINFTGTTANTLNSVVNLTLNADSDSNSGDAYRNIIFQNRGSENMRIAANGNVGIGTNDPQYAKLQVAGSVLFTSTLQVQGLLYLRGDTHHINHDSSGFVQTTDVVQGGSELFLDNNFVRSFNADNGGNIGIGTKSPTEKLTVTGDISSSGDIHTQDKFVVRGSGGLLRIENPGWTSAANHDILYNGWTSDVDDYVYLKAGGNSTSNHGIIAISDTGGFFVGNTDTEYGASTAAPPFDRLDFRVDIEGNVTASGNISASGNIKGNNITTAGDMTIGDDLNISGDQLTFTNDAASAYIRAADSLLIQSDYNTGENKPIYLQPSAVTELSVATGLSTFAGDVVVAGTLTAQEFHTEFVSASILFESGSTKFGDTLDDVHNMTGSLNVTGSAIIDGDVGIGTTNPSQKLHINGGIARFSNNSSNYLEIDGSDAANNHAIISNRFNQLQFKTNTGAGTPHISLLPSTGGNVGIGTASPSEKLHVDGNVQVTTGGNTYLNINHGNVGFIKFTDTSISSPNQFLIQHNYAQDNDFRIARSTGGTDFVIDSNGNTGLGTANPTEKLQVTGNISASGTTFTQLLELPSGAAGSKGINLGTHTHIYESGGLNFDSGTGTRPIYFRINGTKKLELDTAGNVTASGDIVLQGTAPSIRLQDTRQLNNPDWDNVSLGNIEFYSSDTTSPGARVLSEIEAFSNGAAASGPNSDLIFKTSTNSDTSPQTRLTIGHDGTATFSGSIVGTLGTAAQTNITSLGQLTALNINGNLLFENNKELRWKDSGGSERTILELNSSNDLYLGGSFAGSLIFVGGGSYAEVAKFDDSGHFVQASGKNLTTNHITASGNISSSGTGYFKNTFIKPTDAGSALTVYEMDSNNNAIQLRSYANRGDIYLYKDGSKTTEISSIGDSFFKSGLTVGTGSGASRAAILDVTGDIQTLGSNGHITASGNIKAAGTITATGAVHGADLELPSGGIIDWANGDARIVEGETNNYSLTFKTYDGSGASAALRLDGNNDATFTGNITASGNISGSSTSTLTIGGAATIGGTAQASSYKIGGVTVLQGSTNITLGSSGATGTISLTTHTSTPFKIENDDSISITSDTTITGALRATTKSFVIDTPDGGKLEYGSLEGRQHDVFHKGKCNNNVIELPKEWEWLIDNTTLTVQLTAIGKHQNLYVKEIKNNKVYISAGMFKTPNCYFLIHASRKDTKQIEHDN